MIDSLRSRYERFQALSTRPGQPFHVRKLYSRSRSRSERSKERKRFCRDISPMSLIFYLFRLENWVRCRRHSLAGERGAGAVGRVPCPFNWGPFPENRYREGMACSSLKLLSFCSSHSACSSSHFACTASISSTSQFRAASWSNRLAAASICAA
jgi:hypothetical protein